MNIYLSKQLGIRIQFSVLRQENSIFKMKSIVIEYQKIKKTAYGKTLIFYQLHLLVHKNVNSLILIRLYLFYSFNLCNKNKSNK